MAPLPQNNTARYVVHYTSGGREHVQEWRSQPPASPTAMAAFLNQVWSDASPILFHAHILKTVFYAQGADFGTDVVMPGFDGQDYGSGDPTNNTAALFLNFVGRGNDGRRVRVSFYSPIGTDPSWRFNGGEDTHVDDVVADLRSNSVNLKSIGGGAVNWYDYANVGYNAYWQRKRRS